MEPESKPLIKPVELKKRAGAPRWMVTFSDLMAILFALFVLLLSFAEINSDSFKRNAGPIRSAFNMPPESIIPSDTMRIPLEDRKKPDVPVEVEEWKRKTLYKVRAALATELSKDLASVVEKEREIVIRFPDRTAFPSGSDQLTQRFRTILDKVAQILKDTEGQILISGHTDDVPISTAAFRSNWELSTARAVSVVHYLIDRNGLKPGRVTAQGFADSRPLAPNDSPQNRAKNRRVEISVAVPRAIAGPLSPAIVR